jgi:putative ABC transport system permease protein
MNHIPLNRAGRQSVVIRKDVSIMNLLRDLRYGLRNLRGSLGLTLVIVTVLGIGIGANVAMFTVVDAVFLRPLPLPEPDRLVQIQETRASEGSSIPVAYPNFLDWEKQARSFESMGIAGVFQEPWKSAGGNERIPVACVSAAFHRAYRVSAVAGRLFTAADDRPGAPPVALLAHRFWQTQFGGDRSVIGRTLILDEEVWTIAGVVGPFQWDRSADVFLPISLGQSKYGLGVREQRNNTGVIARLKAGVSVTQARAEMNVIAARLARQYPSANGGHGATVTPLREYLGGTMRRPALLMFGAVALVLLVACANVAGLLLAKAAMRRQEIAIRTALGARRVQLIRQLLTESLLMALGGAAVGVGVARVSVAAMLRVFPAAGDLGGIGLDGRVLSFAVLAAALTAVLFGLAPALQLTRADVMEAIKAGGRASRGGGLSVQSRKVLVVGQVAVAVVLVVGAGLLTRSLLEAMNTDPGFRPERVMTAALLLGGSDHSDFSRNSRLLGEASERLAAMPRVEAAGAVTMLPFGNSEAWGQFWRADRPVPAPGQLPNAMQAAATPGYFRAMGIPLLRGRLFTASDGRMPPLKRDLRAVLAYLQSAELVAVINQTMARRFWPGEDPIGRSFRYGPPSLNGPRVTILGIVGDARQLGLDRPVQPQYFLLADQFPVLEARLVVRTTQDLAAMTGLIRSVVAQCQNDAVVTKVEDMDTLIGRSIAGRQNHALLLGVFSILSLALASLGLYATMAYIVARRTQEIGVRMALGAAASDVRKMVVREGLTLAGVGVGIGLVVALAGARLVASMLYGVQSTDAATYAGSAALLIAIMLIASYVPAWRASRVDPLAALRCE